MKINDKINVKENKDKNKSNISYLVLRDVVWSECWDA